MFLFGLLWLSLLRNLAAFHNYTAMYYIGIPLVFYLCFVSLFEKYKSLSYILLVISISLFTFLSLSVNKERNRISDIPNKQTYDFSNISKLIEPESNVYIHGGYRNLINNSPYAVFSYLPHQYITTEQKAADYTISKKRNYRKNTLTPNNTYFYLFKNNKKL